MRAFSQHSGVVVPLDRANIDTDAIIPKQYLKSIRRTGFDKGLFSDWRYLDDGTLNPGFELNQPCYNEATILLVRNNFGCGSSREHAVWAVAQYGFRVIIAPWRESGSGRVPGFADIFYNNSIRNGLLCIELAPEVVDQLFEQVYAAPGIAASVDLESQTLELPAGSNNKLSFEIDAGVRATLLAGLDDIATTLQLADRITAFEQQR